MVEVRFENPKVTIGGSVNSNMAPSILDRFRAMVKQREDEVRVSEDEVVYLSTGEIVRLYELVLSELTFNSKPVIIGLTMIAGEQRKHVRGITDAVCARILEVRDGQKLSALYLLDSIVKNVGREYVTYFGARLPQVFCQTYRQADSTLHPAMRRLFGTWSTVFPLSVLGKIEACLKFSPSLNNQSFSSLNSLKAVERTSPSHVGFDHGFTSVSGRHEQSLEISAACKYNNGVYLDKKRALIDAYGIDEREKSSDYKHQKVDHPNVNDIHKDVSLKMWHDTDEEEFNWEDMSPAFRSKSGSGTNPVFPLTTTNLRSKLSNQGQLSVFNESYNANEDISASSSGPGVTDRIAGFHNEKTQLPSSRFTQESLSLPRTVPHHPFSVKGVGMNHQLPFSAPLADQKPPLVGNFQNADGRIPGSPAFLPKISSSGSDPLPPQMQSTGPASSVAWPPLNIHNRPHSLPSPQTHEKIAYQPATITHQSANESPFPLQQLNAIGNKPQINVSQFSTQKHGVISLHQQFPAHINLMQPQPRPSQEAHQNMVPPTSVSALSDLNYGYTPRQGHVAPIGTAALNNIHSNHSFVPIPNAPPQLLGALPPMPQGPVLSQILPISQNQRPIGHNLPAGGSLSGLLNNLMAKGVISLTYQAPSIKDSVSLEFNQDLNVRHESAITALYADLPRQCTACGLRFKCREAHSTHMDWHVTKNRRSKLRKQKPSRNWFVTSRMWLSSTEALGADGVPAFLPTENVVENNEDEEIAVPADDNQTACALCGERFDDFYSDDTEEWMYKGAVYMNAPSALMAGIDRSQLGPIVHAKCRSETSGVSAEDHQRNERKRKRLPDALKSEVKGKDCRVGIITY